MRLPGAGNAAATRLEKLATAGINQALRCAKHHANARANTGIDLDQQQGGRCLRRRWHIRRPRRKNSTQSDCRSDRQVFGVAHRQTLLHCLQFSAAAHALQQFEPGDGRDRQMQQLVETLRGARSLRRQASTSAMSSRSRQMPKAGSLVTNAAAFAATGATASLSLTRRDSRKYAVCRRRVPHSNVNSPAV